MSAESAQAFVERMKSDETFAKRVAAAESKEDRWAMAKAQGYDFTEEEIEAVTSQLSDEELESVGGGASASCVIGGMQCADKRPGGL